jgi:hypothetical protein
MDPFDDPEPDDGFGTFEFRFENPVSSDPFGDIAADLDEVDNV